MDNTKPNMMVKACQGRLDAFTDAVNCCSKILERPEVYHINIFMYLSKSFIVKYDPQIGDIPVEQAFCFDEIPIIPSKGDAVWAWNDKEDDALCGISTGRTDHLRLLVRVAEGQKPKPFDYWKRAL
jgi:hypothetical protein